MSPVLTPEKSVYATFECSSLNTECKRNSDGQGIGAILRENGVSEQDIESTCTLTGTNHLNRKIYDCSGTEYQTMVRNAGGLDQCFPSSSAPAPAPAPVSVPTPSASNRIWNCPHCNPRHRCVDASKLSFYYTTGYTWSSYMTFVPSYDLSVYATFECTNLETVCHRNSDNAGVPTGLNEQGISVQQVENACQFSGTNNEEKKIYDCSKSWIQNAVEGAGTLQSCKAEIVTPELGPGLPAPVPVPGPAPAPAKPFRATIQRSGEAVQTSGESTCSESAKSACVSAGTSLKTRHCGEDLRWYKPWRWHKIHECEACTQACYDKVTQANLRNILGGQICGKLCIAAGKGALRQYCDHYSARCAKYAKRKQKLDEALLELVKKLVKAAMNKGEEKCREEFDENCNIFFEENEQQDIQSVEDEK